MQAIVCHEHGDPEVMRYEEIPQPTPAAPEVLIKADAIGVNYVDIMRRSGKHPAAPKTPFTPGIEVCGRVAAVGEQVSRFREGDRVIGRCVTHGTYAEYVCAEERFTVDCNAVTCNRKFRKLPLVHGRDNFPRFFSRSAVTYRRLGRKIKNTYGYE